MKRLENRDELDNFLKETADMHRMFPSEKVWKTINKEIHTKPNWYAISLVSLLLLTTAAVTWVMQSYPNKKINQIAKSSPREQTPQNIGTTKPITDYIRFNSIKKTAPVKPVATSFTAPAIAAIAAKTSIEKLYSILIASPINITTSLPNEYDIATHNTQNYIREESSYKLPIVYTTGQHSIKSQSGVDVYRAEWQKTDQPIENVITSYKAPNAKIKWQIFITPTVSYRVISTNQNKANATLLQNTDVKNHIIHKPDIGLQIGLLNKYKLFKNVNLITGLQFNVNKYDIKAYLNRTEVATVTLSETSQFGNRSRNVSAITNYRVSGYNNTDWIKNFYYSISLPIGLEAEFKSKKKRNSSFGFSATIQPTKVLRNRAFVISSDMKNYAYMPSIVRKNNYSTSLEFHTTRSIGKAQLQIGPQVRYQNLSSYISAYPLKENLFDFGLKIGVQFE